MTCATAHFDVSSPRNQPKPCESPFSLDKCYCLKWGFSFFFGCNMRRHLILDAPHAVIVLAHRLSPGFCMDLLHSGPTMWGRVLLFSFLIKHTSEPIVMISGCNSIWWVSDTPLKNPFIFRCCGGIFGPFRQMALTQVSHQPSLLIWLTSLCQ